MSAQAIPCKRVCSWRDHSIVSQPVVAGLLGGDVFGRRPKTAIFNPSLLSVFVVQIKYKLDADTKAERALQLIGILRDGSLPYIALLR